MEEAAAAAESLEEQVQTLIIGQVFKLPGSSGYNPTRATATRAIAARPAARPTRKPLPPAASSDDGDWEEF